MRDRDEQSRGGNSPGRKKSFPGGSSCSSARGCTLALLLVAAGGLSGCQEEPVVPQGTPGVARAEADDEVLRFAVENLNRLAEFDPQEILDQLLVRLNQWARAERSSVTMQVDPLVATLPAPLQQNLLNDLAASRYNLADAYYLREAVFLRDIAGHVCSGRWDPLERAARLFAWTVRNIDLVEGDQQGSERIAQMPWLTVLSGQGRPVDRAWVFARLARQQRLDVVLLAVPLPAAPARQRLWCAALLLDGQLYLFDPLYGSPVYGPDGKSIATLRQVQENPQLLAQFQLPDQPYPLEAEALQDVGIYVVAERQSLSQRMKNIETRLGATLKVALTVRPSEMARKLEALPDVGRVRIWTWPYQAEQVAYMPDTPSSRELQRRLSVFGKFRAGAVNPLWSGRIRQLQGRFASTGELAEAVEEGRDSDLGLADRGAKSLYLQSRTILSDASDAEVPEEMRQHWEKLQRRADRIRCQATYWLGVISLEEQKPKLAEFYFSELRDQWPDSELAGWAQLQLARAYQAQGQREQALQQYRSLSEGGALAAQLEAKRLAAEAGSEP